MPDNSRKIRKATPKEIDTFWEDRFGNRADDGVLFICEEKIDRARISEEDLEYLTDVFEEVDRFAKVPKGICDEVWDIIKDETIAEWIQTIYIAPVFHIETNHQEDELGFTLVEDRNVAKTYGIGWENESDPKEIVVAIDHPLFVERELDDREQMTKHILVSLFHEEGHFRAFYEEEFCEVDEERCVEKYGEERAEETLEKAGKELYYRWD